MNAQTKLTQKKTLRENVLTREVTVVDHTEQKDQNLPKGTNEQNQIQLYTTAREGSTILPMAIIRKWVLKVIRCWG